eukprot:5062257-Prymnesium_polylepis.1
MASAMRGVDSSDDYGEVPHVAVPSTGASRAYQHAMRVGVRRYRRCSIKTEEFSCARTKTDPS